MKRYYVVLFLLAVSATLRAQVSSKQTAILEIPPEEELRRDFVTSFYVEGGGNGVSGSFNLEEKFVNMLSVRLGIGGFGRAIVYTRENSNSTYNRYLWKSVFIISGQYLAFGPQKFLELGVGLTIQPTNSQGYTPYVPNNGESVIPTMTIGYRYQPIESGFMFRIGFTPFFSSDLRSVTPYGGISLGHSF